MKNKIDQFRESVKTSQPIIVCIKCGSTCIDQNFRHQIKCYNCQNVSIWDADRFTVSRDGKENDVVSGINAILTSATRSQSDDSWSGSIIQSLLPIMHGITEMSSVYEDGRSKIEKKDFDELLRLWSDARTKVNAVFENLLTRDDAILE